VKRALIIAMLGLGCGSPAGNPGFPCDFESRCPGTMTCDASTRTCVGGVVMAQCDSPKMQCGSDCVAVQSDPSNCGSCGHGCASSEQCLAATCVAVVTMCSFCPPGIGCVNNQCDCGGRGTFCTALCIDNTQNKISCGGCLAYCMGSGQGCRDSTCVCPAGKSLCGTSCIDTASDPANCGACAHACGSSEKCDQSACVPNCTDNASDVCGDGKCWPIDRDPHHCGATCASCNSDQWCVSGACACPPGTTDTGSGCFDTQRDAQHCGSPAAACGTGQICTAGACACAAGLMTCAGACANTADDPGNCGSCGHACTSGQVCSKGQCVSSCASGEMACSGACADTNSDPFHCGDCTNVCSAGRSCLDGQCASSSPARGCTSCPCDDCTFTRGWLCCSSAAGTSCVDGYRCPE